MKTLKEAAQMIRDQDLIGWTKAHDVAVLEAIEIALAHPEQKPVAQIQVAEDYYPHVIFLDGVDTTALDQKFLYIAPQQPEPPCKTGSQCVGGKCERCAVQEQQWRDAAYRAMDLVIEQQAQPEQEPETDDIDKQFDEILAELDKCDCPKFDCPKCKQPEQEPSYKMPEANRELTASESKMIYSSIPYESVYALARRCLWIAYVWNDHNFDSAHVEAKREAEKQGITNLDEANDFLNAPPQREWKGLTDEEQNQVAWSCGAMSADWLEFAHAIEQALREKNT